MRTTDTDTIRKVLILVAQDGASLFNREINEALLALNRIEYPPAAQPAPTGPKPTTHAVCSLCGGLHGLMAPCATPAPTETERAPVCDCSHCVIGGRIDTCVAEQAPLPTPEQDAIARDLGCYIDPDYAPQGAPLEPALEPMRQIEGTCDHCKRRAPLFLVPRNELLEPYMCEACVKEVV